MGTFNLTVKPLTNIKQFVLTDHLLQCNCSITSDGFDILAADSNKLKQEKKQ